MRFRDFLRVSVLLFGGAATALAVLSVGAIAREDERTLLYVSLAWWLVATVAGLVLGRRPEASSTVGDLLANARKTNVLPELEPGTIVFNRMWPLAAGTVAAGVVGIWFPQVTAIAAGYALLMALLWRRQAAAVEAVEGRDGVEYWFDRSSPFAAPKLVRLPGLRKIDAVPG